MTSTRSRKATKTTAAIVDLTEPITSVFEGSLTQVRSILERMSTFDFCERCLNGSSQGAIDICASCRNCISHRTVFALHRVLGLLSPSSHLLRGGRKGSKHGTGYAGSAGEEKTMGSRMESKEQEENQRAVIVSSLLKVLHETLLKFCMSSAMTLSKSRRRVPRSPCPLTEELWCSLLAVVVPLLKEGLSFSWLDLERESLADWLEKTLEICSLSELSSLIHSPLSITISEEAVEVGVGGKIVAGKRKRISEPFTITDGNMTVAHFLQSLKNSLCSKGGVSDRWNGKLVEVLEIIKNSENLKKPEIVSLDNDSPPRVRNVARRTSGRLSIAPPVEKVVGSYELLLSPFRLRFVSGINDHSFKSHAVSNFTPSAMRRIHSELLSLGSSLPLHENASIFVMIDESRLDLLKAVITGPSETPYDGGIFEFDFLLPPTYPTVPPIVAHRTTGGGFMRFGPNLYENGKVCLSLLGTWSGPGWIPGKSSLLQVFVTLQSMLFVAQPYCLEPGYEKSANSKPAQSYNLRIRAGTLKWAWLEQLRSPPEGFKQIVDLHFSLKAGNIKDRLTEWWGYKDGVFCEEKGLVKIDSMKKGYASPSDAPGLSHSLHFGDGSVKLSDIKKLEESLEIAKRSTEPVNEKPKKK